MAYYSRRKTPREAQELASRYGDFLVEFGGKTDESDPGIRTAEMIHILDTYEIVFSHGPYLAGVREAADKQPAQELEMQLFNRIKAANNEERP
jgi:thiamine biosynthesis protein ThiC